VKRWKLHAKRVPLKEWPSQVDLDLVVPVDQTVVVDLEAPEMKSVVPK
jgi:hypothetical protein